MSALLNMKAAAKAVGVNAVITDSDSKIETQLRRLTKEEQLPILLISWDIDVSLEFGTNGYLKDPSLAITCLLLSKPEDLTKEEAELLAEKMGVLFKDFLMELYKLQSVTVKTPESTITNASYKLLPRYGIAKHSGVLGKFNVLESYYVKC